MKRALKNIIFNILLFILHILDIVIDSGSYVIFAITFKLGMSGETADHYFFSYVQPIIKLINSYISSLRSLKKKNK